MSCSNFNNCDFDKYLGNKLKDCRKRQQLTLVEISEIIGISFQQLQKYEAAVSRIPASLLYKLASTYSISVDAIFKGYAKRIANDNKVTIDTSKKIYNILVVEDNPDDEKITQRALDGIPNLNVMFVHDCAQAIRLLKRNTDFEEFKTPDLVFLDYYMPKRDGISMLRDIKSDSRFTSVPVVMLTNNINAEAMFDAYRLGASGYICKSFDFAKFKEDITSSVIYWTRTVVPPSCVKNVLPYC